MPLAEPTGIRPYFHGSTKHDDLSFGMQPFLSAFQARMRAAQLLFEYWQGSLRDGTPPARTEIDPAAIKSVLPFVLLGDIETVPFRLRFLLIGTAVAEFSRMYVSGIDLN